MKPRDENAQEKKARQERERLLNKEMEEKGITDPYDKVSYQFQKSMEKILIGGDDV